jgi:hypothetical protein
MKNKYKENFKLNLKKIYYQINTFKFKKMYPNTFSTYLF